MTTLIQLSSSVRPPEASVEGTVKRLDDATAKLRREYLRPGHDPWVVAYSGGKDSTLLLQLTWELLETVPRTKRTRRVFVVGNDTLVESPLVIQHLRQSLTTIRKAAQDLGLPIETRITKPHIDQTFWVNLIGRGYIPPTRNFRWCTDRMKIIPTSTLIASLAKKHKGVVLLVGTRKSESTARRRSIERRQESQNATNSHSSIKECRMFAPISDLTDDDVWITLMQREPPWGGSHRQLITLYRNAAGGECPLVLTKDDAPSCGTSSPRFGCWTCTVIKKDRSLRGLIDSGHEDSEIFERLFAFREWLIQLREEDSNRLFVRRNGLRKTRTDGTPVLGPFTLKIRKEILRRLEVLQSEIGRQLISASERAFIEEIWRRDLILANCQNALRHPRLGHPPEDTI